MSKTIEYSSFTFPIIKGLIYVGKRVKNPHQGKWGAIGGKQEDNPGNGLFQEPQYVKKFCGVEVPSLVDQHARNRGKEFTIESAVRELCEEIFADKTYPDDFQPSEFTDFFRFGDVIDTNPSRPEMEYELNLHLGIVHRYDLCLAPDQLSVLKPLIKIDNPNENLWPISKMALVSIKWYCENFPLSDMFRWFPYDNLGEQIPDLTLTEYKNTCLMGVHEQLRRDGLWP